MTLNPTNTSVCRVAIDGPAGTGKSTLARRLARALGGAYLDTGAMYRVATLHVRRAGIDPSDTDRVIEATADLPIQIGSDPQEERVYLAGEDVGGEIRTADVSAHVSAVSAIPEVRENLVALQQSLAAAGGTVILEGRDIGTVVLPDAEVKVFLTASPEVRAQRRTDQDIRAGRPADYESVLRAVIERDRLDSSREASPMVPADDAHLVDTSEMTEDEVLSALIDLVSKAKEPDHD